MEAVVPKATRQKADWAYKVFEQWRIWKSASEAIPPLLEMCAQELDNNLSTFVREARKEDGSRYPGKTLFELIASIQKYICLHGQQINLLRKDSGMDNLRLALDYEMQQSAKEGVGLRERKADYVAFDQESNLWEEGIMGDQNPQALLRALFYVIGTNFGLRSGDEHQS